MDDVVTFPPAECTGCGGPIDLHQPDPGRPDDLVSCCLACGTWLVIRAGKVVARLPGEPIPGRRPAG